MKTIAATRAFALAALVAAALFGSWTRWENRRDKPSSSLNALVGLRLPDGAVVDEVSSESVRGVRLRLAECHAPAFLFLIPIESASTAEAFVTPTTGVA